MTRMAPRNPALDDYDPRSPAQRFVDAFNAAEGGVLSHATGDAREWGAKFERLGRNPLLRADTPYGQKLDLALDRYDRREIDRESRDRVVSLDDRASCAIWHRWMADGDMEVCSECHASRRVSRAPLVLVTIAALVGFAALCRVLWEIAR